ncbi:hypothetical protein K438DRAFT_1947752 [Mycena galopus ATCC 62051]|nr:hypothetical protein K438DRAFT_1947752 [Mycena galopus ATCC 62051]
MQFLVVLLAFTGVAFASTLPTVSSFSAADCWGTPLATFSGVPEDVFCEATPGAVAVKLVPGTERNCQIDLVSTPNCVGVAPANYTTITFNPVTEACFSLGSEFASVRILCITTG